MMLTYLGYAISLGSLVCYVMVVIKMFQHGKTGPGLISTIGLLACGLGALFAFIYGWTKVGEWRIKNLMITWTALILMNIGISVVTFPAAFKAAQEQAIRQQEAARAKTEAVPAPAPQPLPTPAPGPANP